MNPVRNYRPLPGAGLEPTAPARTAPAGSGPGGVAPVTPELVWQLMGVRGYPLASVLMSTAPAARMLPREAARLRGLVDEATRRLADSGPRDQVDAVVGRLEDLAEEAADSRTLGAVALYAGVDHGQAVELSLPVRDRVAVDPTYATRDLVRALHRTPRHVLLLITGTEARLFEGVGGTLTPVAGDDFPVVAESRERSHGRGNRDALDRAFLRSVDRALSAHLADRPAPVVLAGQSRVLATFRGMSRNLGRLAGTIPGSHGTASLAVLQERVRPVLDTYLHSRQDDALDLLQRRARAGRVVSGIGAAWVSASMESPEMLAVEDGLYVPSRVSADGELAPAADVTGHDVLDDAVDELIETVLVRGGWVALVEDGTLAAYEGVALTLRGGRR